VKTDKSLAALAAVVPESDVRVPSVSEWSIGMHVHHCCLSMLGISRALVASTPPPPRSRPPWITSVILLTGRIPRGRAQAPRAVIPLAPTAQADLLELLNESGRQLDLVTRLDPQAWFKHFELGVLRRDRALRFIHVHNEHHVRIVSDILSAQQ